jgi:hypothetical protein
MGNSYRTCRGWLASEGVGTVNDSVTVRSLSLASQLLQSGYVSGRINQEHKKNGNRANDCHFFSLLAYSP